MRGKLRRASYSSAGSLRSGCTSNPRVPLRRKSAIKSSFFVGARFIAPFPFLRCSLKVFHVVPCFIDRDTALANGLRLPARDSKVERSISVRICDVHFNACIKQHLQHFHFSGSNRKMQRGIVHPFLLKQPNAEAYSRTNRTSSSLRHTKGEVA